MDSTPQIIGDPSGRKSGWAEAGGKRFEVFENPAPEFDLPPQFKNRNRFKEFLYEKHGLPKTRPSGAELTADIDRTMLIEEEGLFNHVFGGRSNYKNKSALSGRHRNVWNSALSKMRKNIETEKKAGFKTRKDEYDYTKGLADEELEDYDDYKKSSSMTFSQQVLFNQKMRAAVEDQVYEAKQGGKMTPEQLRILPKRLKEQYKMDTLPGYKPDPKVAARSRTAEDSNGKPFEVYFNFYDQAFKDIACTIPFMGEKAEPDKEKEKPGDKKESSKAAPKWGANAGATRRRKAKRAAKETGKAVLSGATKAGRWLKRFERPSESKIDHSEDSKRMMRLQAG